MDAAVAVGVDAKIRESTISRMPEVTDQRKDIVVCSTPLHGH